MAIQGVLVNPNKDRSSQLNKMTETKITIYLTSYIDKSQLFAETTFLKFFRDSYVAGGRSVY